VALDVKVPVDAFQYGAGRNLRQLSRGTNQGSCALSVQVYL
jgi:hypothetical protein